MKRFYSAAALLLAALTVFAQTQSRDIRTIRLLPRETYGDAVYQKNTNVPVAVGSFERKTLGDVSLPPDLPAGQAPRGGGGAPSPNDGVLTNLRDVPSFNGPDTRRVRKPINGREGGASYSFSRRTHEWDGRSINYGSSDLLVAFRVIEIDSDGSALIDWKLLKRFRTPRLAKY